jgi:hypothetical protein
MLNMIFQCFAINQDVVSVCSTEDIKIWAKGFVNISLDGNGCICESEWYN